MDPITIATVTVSLLSPYLAKIGQVAAEKIGASLPEYAGKLWETIMQKFKGRPAAEEAAKDLAKNPTDADNQAAFRKEIRKATEEDPSLRSLLTSLLEKAEKEAATQSNKIDGDNNVAVNIGGNVQGNIVVGSNNKINDK